MLRWPYVLATVVLVFGTLGCDSSDSNTTQVLAPLTSDQKNTALVAFQSATVASSAVQSLKTSAQPATPGNDPISQRWVQMTGILHSAMNSNLCTVVFNADSFKVSGTNCPVSADNETPSLNLNSSTVLGSQYRAIDPNYAKLNDVTDLKMTITSNATLNGDTAHVTSNGNGEFVSQSLGTINFTLSENATFAFSSNANTSEMQVSIRFQFPGFVAELVEKETSNGAQPSLKTYFLNGEQLSEGEVKTYIDLPFEGSRSFVWAATSQFN